MKEHPRAQPIVRVKSSTLLDVSLSKASVEGSLTRIPRACSKGKRVQPAARTCLADMTLIKMDWDEFISCDAQVHCLLRSQLNWIWVAGSAAGLGFMPSAGQLAHSPRFSHHWLVAPSFNQVDLAWSVVSQHIVHGISWDFSAVSRHARTRVATKLYLCGTASFLFIAWQELMVGRCDLQMEVWRALAREDNSALLDRMGQHSIVPFLPLIRILVVCRTMKLELEPTYHMYIIKGLPPMPLTPQCARKRPASRRDLNDPFHVP